MVRQNKTQKSTHLPIRSIGGWLENRFTEFRRLVQSIIHFGSFSPLIKPQALQLLVYSLIYPVARIILGEERSRKICDSFFKKPFPSKILLPSFLIKSKIILRGNEIDWGSLVEIYEDDIYHMNTLKEGMNVVDIGAYIGAYTVLVAEKVGKNGKVIAIEPEPQNYEQLLKNIKLNNFHNVTPIKIALTDHEGFEKIYLHSLLGCHSLIFQENKDSYLNIPVKRLDKLLEELNLKRVDIIKIDTEGAEIPILKGAEKTLKANPNIKIIVASYHYPSEIEEVWNFLHERGFRTKVSRGGIVTTV